MRKGAAQVKRAHVLALGSRLPYITPNVHHYQAVSCM